MRIPMDKENMSETKAMIQALANTGIRVFMYYPQTKSITIPQNTCEAYRCKEFYDNMPQSFADDFVYENDHDVFKEMYEKINRGEKTAAATFHSKDLNYCIRVTLTTVRWTADGQPKDVFGIIENWSALYKNKRLVDKLQEELNIHNSKDDFDDALKTMATSIGSQYVAVYYIWLETHTYVCFQEQVQSILSIIGEKGLYESAWDAFITGFIEEKDQKSLREFVDIATLADRIGHKNSITVTYRRKNIGWTRGQFIVGKRDEKGTPLTVIYTVSDINEEVETKLQKEKAEQEALRDPLTKLWNRKAFDQYKEDQRYKQNQSGVMLFDIDRFKEINDRFGHDTGDQVLIMIANEMRDILRQNDLVFRMGGDEFAILLYNCNESIWNTVCRKIGTLHSNIRDRLPSEMNVTISAGLCVNSAGYRDEMYKLADRAMYNTKTNGRGGCSFVSLEGKMMKEWHDNSSFLRKGDVLEKNSIVTWRLDEAKKPELKHRVFGDELFCSFVGLDSSATPEELYQAWAQRVEPGYFDVIKEAEKLAINDGKVEVVFDWNHPEKGVIQLRCSASFESETKDYYSFIGYIHVITGTHVVTMEDIDAKIKNALEELYLCNFYIRLNDYSFKVYKAQPSMRNLLESSENAIHAVKSYLQDMVAEESREEMSAFLDLTTIQQRMKTMNVLACNYYALDNGWSKATFLGVDRNEAGDVETVSLIVEAISQEKNASTVEAQMKHSLEIEGKLWSRMKNLISKSKVNIAINSIMQEVLDYYNADRAYIFEFDWEQKIGINTYEVCAPGVEPVIDTLQGVPIDKMNVWIKLFNEKTFIQIKDLNELVDDESRKEEYNILAPQGIQSLIAAPVYFDEKVIGFLGVDNPKCNFDDTILIESLAYFCVKESLKENARGKL